MSQDYNFGDTVYDLILIDGNHKYEGVKADYELAVSHCKYLAFHDIYLQYKCGVPKLWNEIKTNHDVVAEISNTDPFFKMPVGIGILKIV